MWLIHAHISHAKMKLRYVIRFDLVLKFCVIFTTHARLVNISLAYPADVSLYFIHFSGCWKCGLDRNGRPSCCGQGGTWEGKCGQPGDTGVEHTWGDGLRSCAMQKSGENLHTCTSVINAYSYRLSDHETNIHACQSLSK